MLITQQLTKEEEASASAEDMEVRREDQEKINKFSSLHQKETSLEEELRAKIVSAAPRHLLFFMLHLAIPTECRISHCTLSVKAALLGLQREWYADYKQKEKEDLEEISTELELVDEEEKVPYV